MLHRKLTLLELVCSSQLCWDQALHKVCFKRAPDPIQRLAVSGLFTFPINYSLYVWKITFCIGITTIYTTTSGDVAICCISNALCICEALFVFSASFWKASWTSSVRFFQGSSLGTAPETKIQRLPRTSSSQHQNLPAFRVFCSQNLVFPQTSSKSSAESHLLRLGGTFPDPLQLCHLHRGWRPWKSLDEEVCSHKKWERHGKTSHFRHFKICQPQSAKFPGSSTWALSCAESSSSFWIVRSFPARHFHFRSIHMASPCFTQTSGQSIG